LKRKASVAMVDVCAIDLARFKEKLPAGTVAVVRTYQVDVRDSRQVVDCVRSALDAFNGIDYLVNCAGISSSHLIVDIPEDERDKVFAINIEGVFLFSREVAKEMIQRKTEKKRQRSLPGLPSPWPAAQIATVTFEEYRQKIFIGLTPLGRMAKPEDVARAVAFLALDGAEFITGTTLNVSGGGMH